ncbi:methyltransferase domain-containing protein [Flavobacteriaceae bacterium R38]|nr:methyltransferase domain-containing protein [Flavobacteriaceae bacterium R38]
MSKIQDTKSENEYWSKRYLDEQTGWDIGYISTPLKEYIDQLEDKNIRILIPGAGNAYEAEYLFNNGFKNTFVLDISSIPLNALKKRLPEFPESHLKNENFFEHQESYDLTLEQTFFCSFEPNKENRTLYAQKMASLLKPNGKLVGLWFNHPLSQDNKRPFGGSKEEYLGYLSPYFEVKLFESCFNSIKPRAGNELFGIFIKK